MTLFQRIKGWFSSSPTEKPIALAPAFFYKVANRITEKSTPRLEAFLPELIRWARTAPDEIFTPNTNRRDVYSSIYNRLGPWDSLKHRKAVMCEVLRVLGGFESAWDWNCGRDTTNSTSITPETIEAGIFQVSANSMVFGNDLKALVISKIGTSKDGNAFQALMKADHACALEYAARLLRHTTQHNGPVKRHEIDEYLSRDAVDAFESFL